MNRYALVKAGVDFNKGLRRFNNNKDMYESFLSEFQTDENFAGLSHALEQQDAKTAFQYAHALKDVAGNLSLQKIYEALVPLVEQLRQGIFDQAPALFIPVRESYETLCKVLKEQE